MNIKLKPIESAKTTITAQVQERIRAAILEGDLEPGSRIDQAKLAAHLNVSLVPVREALNRLEAEGFVHIVPRRGAFVTQTSINDMEDLYAARRLLEGEAAFLAASRLSDDDLRTLERLSTEMNKALDDHDYSAFMVSNRQFHFIIYAACNSRYLIDMIKMLWDLAERYRYRYLFLRDNAPAIKREHQAILDYCRSREGERLREAIVFHMNRTLEGLETYIHEHNGGSLPGPKA